MPKLTALTEPDPVSGWALGLFFGVTFTSIALAATIGDSVFESGLDGESSLGDLGFEESNSGVAGAAAADVVERSARDTSREESRFDWPESLSSASNFFLAHSRSKSEGELPLDEAVALPSC